MDLDTDSAFAELGLASDATELEVKAAWRRLVSQWHPDRNGSASAVTKMQRINRALEQIRRAGFRVDPLPRGADDTTTTTTASAAADRDRQRAPIHRKVKLTLEEAAAGCIKVLRGKICESCSICAGAGHQVLGGNCAQCGGSGAVSKRSWFGWPGARVECEACLGGGIARQPCQACAGTGKSSTHKYKVSVRIPHGVRHGDRLHVDGQGRRPGQPPADLDIRVQVLAHPFFELDDDGSIRCELPVDGFAWIANRPIQVPTLAGLQPMQLNRERLTYRLNGQGFPMQRRGSCGDHVVTVVPVFPAQFSTDQEILLDQLMAGTSGAAGQASDDRLAAWNRQLRAWERGLAARGNSTS